MIDFQDLKITTMTLVFELDTMINKGAVFHLVPITKMEIDKHYHAQKYVIPVSTIPGSILSIKYRNMVRGIIENNKRRFFKNTVPAKMSTSMKNVSLKISPKTLQLCGASSRANGLEASQYMIQHIMTIKKTMDCIKNNPIVFNQCVAWIEQETRGEMIEKTIIKEYAKKRVLLRVHRQIPDYTIIIPDIDEQSSLGHDDILVFLLSLASDQQYYSDYMHKIKNIIHLDSIVDNHVDDINILRINEVMVNYNYNLGFRVNRDELNRLMNGRNGLYSYYDNALVNCVTVELPYDDKLLTYKAKKMKKEIAHHTFLIYKSGAVTQSGPCSNTQPGPSGKLMEHAYNTFMKSVKEIEDLIRL